MKQFLIGFAIGIAIVAGLSGCQQNSGKCNFGWVNKATDPQPIGCPK